MAQTDEISKTIALLKFETIRDTLKQSKCKSQGAKPQLVKNYEAAVLDVGVEKFVTKLPADVVTSFSKELDVEVGANQSPQEALTEKIQGLGIADILRKTETDTLKKFSNALGLEDEGDYAKKLEDEVMLIGMEGFLQNLNPDLLRKHCTELGLAKSGSKAELVEKLMVHIFELEPLDKKEGEKPEKEKKESEKEKKDGEKEKQKEEAKPKETKKRKAAEPKESATEKKAKVESESGVQRPKRKATKKKVEEDEEEEEKPVKKQKKEAKAPKEKAAPKTKTAKKEKATRTPYVAPPLSTIVKGAYNAADLHNKFNLTDLQKYAKQEGIKTSGQKKLIIKRIVNYLETGSKEEKVSIKAKSKKAAPKKKATAAGSKKKATKADKEKKEEKSEKAEEKSE